MLIPEHEIHNLLFNPAAVIHAGLVRRESPNNTGKPPKNYTKACGTRVLESYVRGITRLRCVVHGPL